MLLAICIYSFLVPIVVSFSFGSVNRWCSNKLTQLNALQKDEKGYIVKDRQWFNGLSLDAGASLTDPRAIPQAARDFADRISQGGKVQSIEETLALIDTHYNYFEVPFTNGDLVNPANTNIGSAKIFSFGILTRMDEKAVLRLFGPMVDTLAPGGTDHQNIRNFMKYGWDGVKFTTGLAIVSKLQAYDDTESAMATQAGKL